MAFITNQKVDGTKKLGERLGELMGHADRLDMLVGFFFFSGVKVLYDALKARAGMKMRVLVGMEAEMAMDSGGDRPFKVANCVAFGGGGAVLARLSLSTN